MTKSAAQARIAVGMDRNDAAKLLRRAGAKVTKIDGLPPESAANYSGAAYETPTGGLLIVNYYRASPAAPYHISGLSLCKDPDVPKVRRVWRDVKIVKV